MYIYIFFNFSQSTIFLVYIMFIIYNIRASSFGFMTDINVFIYTSRMTKSWFTSETAGIGGDPASTDKHEKEPMTINKTATFKRTNKEGSTNEGGNSYPNSHGHKKYKSHKHLLSKVGVTVYISRGRPTSGHGRVNWQFYTRGAVSSLASTFWYYREIKVPVLKIKVFQSR